MLLCVAGGGVSSFVKDMPGRTRTFSGRHVFATGEEDSNVMDGLSLISSFNQDLQEQHVTYRSKVLFVQEEDSNSKTCIVSRSMYNSSTGSSAVVFNYRSRSGSRSFTASGCHVNHVQRVDTPPLHSFSSSTFSTASSSSSSTSSSSSSSSSSITASTKKDGVATSAWAQILELEGYRSPAVGLDGHVVDIRANEVSSGSEERDKLPGDDRPKRRIYRKNTPASVSSKYKSSGSQCVSPVPSNAVKPSLAQKKPVATSDNRCSPVHLEKRDGDSSGTTRTASSSDTAEVTSIRKSNANSQPNAVSAKSPEHDPNASWGRYSSRAMRDSARKVAERYAQNTYVRRQNCGRIRQPSGGDTAVASTRTSRLFKKQTDPVNISPNKNSSRPRISEFNDDTQPVSSNKYPVKSFGSRSDENGSVVSDWRKILCKNCSSALESEPIPHHQCSRRKSIDCSVYGYKKQDFVVANKTSRITSDKNPTCCAVTKEPSFTLITDSSESSCGESSKEEERMITFSDTAKKHRSDECWKLTAEEMSQLVNGSASCNLSYKRAACNATASKWTSWIQKQKEKRKPVFFIGDDPASFTEDPSGDIKGSCGPKRSLSLFEAKRIRHQKCRHSHNEVGGDSFRKSMNGSTSVTTATCISDSEGTPTRQVTSAFSVQGKSANPKRSSSICSGIGGGCRKTLQASPIREEKRISRKDPSEQNEVSVSHGCNSSLCGSNSDDVCRHFDFNDLNDPEACLQEGNTDPSDVTEMVATGGNTVSDRSGSAHEARTEQLRVLKFRRSSNKPAGKTSDENLSRDGCKQITQTKDVTTKLAHNGKNTEKKGVSTKKACQQSVDNLKEYQHGRLHSGVASKNKEKIKDLKNNEKVKETKKSEKAKETHRDLSEGTSERSAVMGKLMRIGNITRTLSLHSLKRKQKQLNEPRPLTKSNAPTSGVEEKLSSNLRKCLSYAELGSGARPSQVSVAFKKKKYSSSTSNAVLSQAPDHLRCTCTSNFKRTVSLPSSFPLRHPNRRSHFRQQSKSSLGYYHSSEGCRLDNNLKPCSNRCSSDRDENGGSANPKRSLLVKKDTRSKYQAENHRNFMINKRNKSFILFERVFAFNQSLLDVNEKSFNQNILIMGLGSNHVLIGAADSYSQVTMVEEHFFTDRTFSSSSDSSPTMSFVSEESTSPVPQFRHKKSSTLSRAERNNRRKSASEGTFRSVRKTLSNVLESQRPTSQFYADLDDQLFSDSSQDPNVTNLFRLSSVTSGSQPILTAANQSYSNPNGTAGMLTGYPSLRTSTPHLSPVDSLVRKFRKSFALRFQKRKPDQPLNPTAEDVRSVLSSPTSAKNGDSSGKNIKTPRKPKSPITSPPLSPLKDKQNISENSATNNFVLLPVRERKNHRMRREGRFSLFCDGFDNAISNNATLNKAKCIKPQLAGSDVNILRKRAASTSDYSPKSKALQRPFSVVDYVTLDSSLCPKTSENKDDLLSATHEGGNGMDVAQKNGIDQVWRSNPVKLCRVHSRLMMCRHKGRYRLRRSISHPVELEMAGSINVLGESTHCSTDQDSSQKGSLSSDDDASSDSDMYHNYCCSPTRRSNTCWELCSEGIMYAEALWDHEALDSEELPFQTGDVIEVTDTSDTEWWWGTRGGRSGWFPASFVRMYICHRVPSMNFQEQTIDGEQTPYSPCKTINNNLTCDQIRANIVTEIVATERDYVKHLKDVVEGYLRQVHRRPDMFSNERIGTVFGNIEQIYTFQSQFLSRLEECFQKDTPHLSQIGNSFLDHKEEFKMYSQYCNNHPLAVSELQELFSVSKYAQFFEACRLLREMIDISLDGFLLTPIQRICKYPLQLAELLKYTDSSHPDHIPVTKALAAMKEVAELVNERKRRMECLERIAEWQNSIEGWVGPDVLERSSILIHCGEVTRVSSTWSRDVYLFIFDHQLVYCKKDILKRNTYVYKGRLDLDCCDIIDVEDGRDVHFGVNVKNAWKIFYKDKEKWFLFYAKTAPEKDQWLCAFATERQTVEEDREQGFVVTEDAKKAARLAVLNKQKPKRPRAKFSKSRRCHPDAAVTELLVLDLPSAKARSGSLPSNIHPELAIMAGAKLTPSRKKGSGWFHFGSGKKPKT